MLRLLEKCSLFLPRAFTPGYSEYLNHLTASGEYHANPTGVLTLIVAAAR